MSRRRSATGLALALATVLAACSTSSGAGTSGPSARPTDSEASAQPAQPTSPTAVDLTVYAAASLKGALEAVETAYEAAVPGATLTVATDSSATLRTQIQQGAPADVFLSADQANPQELVEAGLSDGAAVDFAGNTQVVIVPAANPAGITTPADLAKPGTKIVAAGAEVPITRYATQVVANLASQPGYPAGFFAAFDANVVSREDNVKAVVAKIELGEADAAIVYATDARASANVRAIDIPATATVPATYAGVVVKATAHAAEARNFLVWLAGPDGQAVLATFGFLPPG